MKIYRIIRKYQNTITIYPETDWHTSYEYCQNYLDNIESVIKDFYGYQIETNELIED